MAKVLIYGNSVDYVKSITDDQAEQVYRFIQRMLGYND